MNFETVIGVDTGGGPVKTNGDDGVRVAEVQADLDLHGVTVETTASGQLVTLIFFIHHLNPLS